MSYDDDDYDNDDDGGDIETNASVTVDLPLGPIQSAVARIAASQLRSGIDSIAADLVKKAVDEKITEYVDTAVTTALKELLAEGWHQTDNWGNPKGPKLSLKDRIGLALTEKPNYDKQARIDVLVTQAVEKTLASQLKPEVDAAVAKFRQIADSVVQAKIQETLKHALGLK